MASPYTTTTATSTKKNRRELSPELSKGVFTPAKTARNSTSVNKNMGSRALSQSTGFTRHMGDKSQHLSIHHEVSRQKLIVMHKSIDLTNINRSPSKRDPILQNNEEKTHAFKPACKRVEGAGETTMFTAEEKPRNTKPGEYHPHHGTNPPKKEKINSIKKIHSVPSKSHHELKKRELKTVQTTRESFNPITEGDPKSVKTIKIRNVEQQISEHMSKLNDKKHLLPSERAVSPRRAPGGSGQSPTRLRVNMAEEHEHYMASPPKTVLTEPDEVHPQVKKHRGTISTLLNYKFAGEYRDQGVTDKPHKVPAKIVQVKLTNERHFLKKKADYGYVA